MIDVSTNNEELKIDEKDLIKDNYYCINGNQELFEKYNFISKTEDGKNTLVPQFWWGNLKEPSIVILAKNPSYKTKGKKNDDRDNTKKEIREYFINNIKRNEPSFNSNFFDIIPDSFVVDWWKNKFFVQQELDDLKDKIAILNLFGYYSADSDYLGKISDDDLKKSHICKNKDKIKKIMEKDKVKAIIFLWQGSENVWNKVLSSDEKMKEKFFDDELIKKKLYFANFKNGRNPKFIDIISCNDKIEIEKMSKNNRDNILSYVNQK